MSDHYYTNDPSSTHQFQHFSFSLKGKTFTFKTDNGVFSKHTIDYGSRVLIETFQPNDKLSGTLLDVGCGYGAIGLSLARFVEKVEMIDINERAIGLAKENAAANQIKNVTIHTSNLYEKVIETSYSAIVSNPPVRAGKKVVHDILQYAYPLLKEKGQLTIVLQKKQGAKSAAKKMEEVFGNVHTLAKEKGYYILQSTKE